MSEEAELASPAAAIVARRESRSAMPERLKVAARRQLRRRMGTGRGGGRFRRGGQRCGDMRRTVVQMAARIVVA